MYFITLGDDSTSCVGYQKYLKLLSVTDTRDNQPRARISILASSYGGFSLKLWGFLCVGLWGAGTSQGRDGGVWSRHAQLKGKIEMKEKKNGIGVLLSPP